MKTGKLLNIGSKILGGCLALGLGLTPGLAMADGTETLGPPSITILTGTGTTAAAASLDANTGLLTVNVPVGAVVKQVLLYWAGRRLVGADGTNENSVFVQGGFGGEAVVGELIGGPSPEFGLLGNNTNPIPRSFRADITALAAVGPGQTLLNVTRGNPTTLATSIIVIFDEVGVAYGGRAIGVISKVLTNFTRVVDTGALPPNGGFLEPAPVLNVKGVPGLIASKTVSASTLGVGGSTVSKAEIDGTRINALGSIISAQVINSTAIANCQMDGTARVIGTSDFLNLKILGLKLPINFKKPNTTLLNLGLVKIVANQQIFTGAIGSSSRSITVNGLRVTTPLTNKLLGKLLGKVANGSIADITLASSTAAVSCILAGPAVTLRDGADFAFRDFSFTPNLGTTAVQTFTFPATPFARSATLGLFVADAESTRPDIIVVKVPGAPDITLPNFLDGGNGPNADLEGVLVQIPAGATTLSVQVLSDGSGTSNPLPDSVVWVWAALSLPSGMSNNLYSGQATVANVGVLGIINAVVGDTGPLPFSGGELDATVNALPLLPLLASITGQARVEGAGNVSMANASVERLGLNILGIKVAADVLSSFARAECDANGDVVLTGNSTLANLFVGGSPVLLTTGSTISILGGIVRINERIVNQAAGTITVNALRINVGNPIPLLGGDDLANVVIGQSRAHITCN